MTVVLGGLAWVAFSFFLFHIHWGLGVAFLLAVFAIGFSR